MHKPLLSEFITELHTQYPEKGFGDLMQESFNYNDDEDDCEEPAAAVVAPSNDAVEQPAEVVDENDDAFDNDGHDQIFCF